MIDYANAGGRVFATHYSYVWMTNNDGTSAASPGPLPFSQTASWLVDQQQVDVLTATVDQTLQSDPATQARRVAFAQWLKAVGASTVAGQIAIEQARDDLTAVSPIIATAARTPPQRWLYATTPFSAPLHYTFDTPVAYAPSPLPTKQCGRVLFSDFHVANADPIVTTTTFPDECTDGPLTPQEQTLEFMLFDLASCVEAAGERCKPAAAPTSTCRAADRRRLRRRRGVALRRVFRRRGIAAAAEPGSCGTGAVRRVRAADVRADVQTTCGAIGNGCGGLLECGDTCSDGQRCAAEAGIANVCGLVLR